MADEERTPPEESPEIATSTLAEIYAQQGLYDRALTIYRKLQGRNPEDEEIAARIAELVQAAEEADPAGAGPPPEPGAIPVPLEEEPGVAPEEPGPAGKPPPVEEDEAFRAWLEKR
ncbi:MAG: hypothetical protein R3199_10460 [Gemmatimonadota bacterium]|nr:hypothetical protein [Gemmatimonadota bacterium]